MSRYITLLLYIGILRGQCDFNNDGQLDSLDISEGVNCILVNCYNGTQSDKIQSTVAHISNIFIYPSLLKSH
jgi:hypothetical protein